MNCLLAEQLKGRYQCGIAQPQYAIHTTDVSKLVRIGDVTAIPSHEKVTAVERRGGKVQGVTGRIVRHDLPNDIGIDGLRNGFIKVEQRESPKQIQHLPLLWKLSGLELSLNGKT